MVVNTTILIDGSAAGRLLVLRAPLSFWGGVDARTGCIIDPTSDRAGCSIDGRILVLASTRGSSSSSSVLLELIRLGRGPAALIVGQADAILPVAILVARELGYIAPPAALLSPDDQRELPNDAMARLSPAGQLDIQDRPT